MIAGEPIVPAAAIGSCRASRGGGRTGRDWRAASGRGFRCRVGHEQRGIARGWVAAIASISLALPAFAAVHSVRAIGGMEWRIADLGARDWVVFERGDAGSQDVVGTRAKPGGSFRPLLENPQRPWKTAVCSQYPRVHDGRKLIGRSMRTEQYRLTRWVEVADRSSVAAVELYDLVADPQENTNLAAEPGRTALLERLTAQAERGWRGAVPVWPDGAEH